MRYITMLLLAFTFLAPARGIEQPTGLQEASTTYPKASLDGIEDLRLGSPLPAKSAFPGLVYKTTNLADYDEEGRPITRTFLKLYHRGFYVGSGMLDEQKRLVELEIVDWRVSFGGDFAPSSTWNHLKTQLPQVKLHFADNLDALVAESPELPGLQVHFSPSLYGTQSRLKGEFTPLSLNGLPGKSKASKMRLFWIPSEI